MADIAKLSVGREAYYTRGLATDHEAYLSGHGESPGGWYGAGADSLGLQGEASPAGFQQMFEGRHPAVFLRRGPWGYIDGADPDVTGAHLRIGSLDELSESLTALSGCAGRRGGTRQARAVMLAELSPSARIGRSRVG